jgi:hypothetical protein
MRTLLLLTTAAMTLSNLSAHAEFFGSSGPACSGTNSLGALQPILQQNIVDVVSLASPDDPYKVNMDGSHIITEDATPHKAECKILLEISNKAHPSILLKKVTKDDGDGEDGFTDDDWITYSVQITDKGDETFVNARWSADLKTHLQLIKSKAELAKLQKEAAEKEAAEQEAARKAKEAKEEAEAKEKAAAQAKDKIVGTDDTATSCAAGLKALKYTAIDPADIRVISFNVCSAYVVQGQFNVGVDNVYSYAFAQISYQMTLGGAKFIKQVQAWRPYPVADQVVPQGMKHNDDSPYYYSEEDLFPDAVNH